MNNKIKQQSNFYITVLIVIGILVVVNFFAYQIFIRFDLTQNKDYSISKVSKRTVGNLDDLVNIKLYFSDNLPNRYITLRQEVGDILDEYSSYSNGNIRVEFVDIKDDEEIKRDLYMMGIPQLQFNVIEKDKYQVVTGYLGMAVQYGDHKEVIPVVETTRNLEYQVTLAIKKVTGQVSSIIGFVTSNNTFDLDNEISEASKKVRELYEVREIDLATTDISNDINTLIIVGPREEFNEGQLQKIDDFVMSGGYLLVIADGVVIGEGLSASINNTGLDNLLINYGIKLNHDLVLDVISGRASFSQGFMNFSTSYPLWPMIVKKGFDADNAVVSSLESLILGWTSSVEVINQEEGNRVSFLAKTSSKSWAQTENFNLNPQQMFTPSGNIGSKTLAVSVSGKFNSAYGNKSTDTGRIIVVGDADFIHDDFSRQYPDNMLFFQNLVDSLSLDEDLISIRSKGILERPIKELSDGVKAGIRYSNIFGITILVIVFGLARYFIRKRSKFVDEL